MSLDASARRPSRRGAHPVTPMLLPVPILCFVGALIADWAYTASPDMLWIDFSSWLLMAGLIGGGLAIAALVVRLVRAHADRGAIGLPLVLLGSAWIVELVNSFIHTRDGWTAVVPTGIILSAIGVILSLAAGWTWQSISHREGAVR
ncbi:hypothetical protein G7077_02230 [Sphingomonas piscis]|uniref:DUF2231 domain-containing protein n=1 Tax=Sphingomonas piscis TaxID=2714943 RepID=A0A6G7YMF2_9SPHN|nr:DUF2231 domain-containing protein [Sphingomonas piscis]QIK77907.1 hypothetical protein G7077_02230 [Sphingomonas piscis]